MNYDDHDDFYEDQYEDGWDADDSMDGDHDSAMESAGWGVDEDYGHYDDDYGNDFWVGSEYDY